MCTSSDVFLMTWTCICMSAHPHITSSSHDDSDDMIMMLEVTFQTKVITYFFHQSLFGSSFRSKRQLLLFQGCGNIEERLEPIDVSVLVSFMVALCLTSRSLVPPCPLSGSTAGYLLSSCKSRGRIKSVWSQDWGTTTINRLLANRWFPVIREKWHSLRRHKCTVWVTDNLLLFLFHPPFQLLQAKLSRIPTDWLTREGHAIVVGTKHSQTNNWSFWQ